MLQPEAQSLFMAVSHSLNSITLPSLYAFMLRPQINLMIVTYPYVTTISLLLLTVTLTC